MKLRFLAFGFLVVLLAGLTGQADAALSVVSVTKITENGHFSAPQWSPDGTKIYASGENGSIVVMNADGSGLQTLHAGDGYFRKFAVSPDGNKILYEYSAAGAQQSALWMMDSLGSSKVVVADKGVDPHWTQDGTKYGYTNAGTWVVDVASEVAVKVSDGYFLTFINSDLIAFKNIYNKSFNVMNIVDSSLVEEPSIRSASMVEVEDGDNVYVVSGMKLYSYVISLQMKNIYNLNSNVRKVLYRNGSLFYLDTKYENESSALLNSRIGSVSKDGASNVNIYDPALLDVNDFDITKNGRYLVLSTFDGFLYSIELTY